MKVKLYKIDLQNASFDELWAYVKAEWERLKADPSLVGSPTTPFQAVLLVWLGVLETFMVIKY